MRITPILLLAVVPVCAGTAADTAILVEAESGTLGSQLTTGTDGSVSYVTTSVSYGDYAPSTTTDVATLTVTFPEAGTYDLYARLYVGSGTFNDDSFFYGTGLGTRTLSDSDQWVMVNNLANACGYSSDYDYILDSGAVTTEAWKWVKLTGYDSVDTTFTVESGALTQTFQFAGREDGLWIDKFAFAPTGMYFTVSQIENGEAGTYTEPGNFTPTGPEIASGKSKFLGSCYSSTDTNNVNYDKYWNAVWPGNSGKWGVVEATQDTMDWAELDEAYNFAKDHGYMFNMHVLVWGNQQPTWISSMSTDDQIDQIEEWFQAVADRYPDIDYLQVVNEPLHAPPDDSGEQSGNYIDALGGTGTTGYDWIINAFRLAKQIFPNTKLMINDYSIAGSTTATANYKAIIQSLQAENLIDAIGLQGHAFSTVYYSATQMKNSLDSLAETGLPIFVTEMDVDGTDDQVQLDEFKRVFPVFWEHPDVIGVNISGHTIGMWRTEEGAYLVNSDNSERPALQWLRSYVQSYEDWQDYDVTLDWADTGDWLGEVYVGYNPWIYTSDGNWIWVDNDNATADGCWAYLLNTSGDTHDFTQTAGTWLGYTLNGYVADTGAWLGSVNAQYAPWIWTGMGWIWAYEDTATDSGMWAWMQKPTQ